MIAADISSKNEAESININVKNTCLSYSLILKVCYCLYYFYVIPIHEEIIKKNFNHIKKNFFSRCPKKMLHYLIYFSILSIFIQT